MGYAEEEYYLFCGSVEQAIDLALSVPYRCSLSQQYDFFKIKTAAIQAAETFTSGRKSTTFPLSQTYSGFLLGLPSYFNCSAGDDEQTRFHCDFTLL